MKYDNEIAIKILREEYADYDENSWHYDREYKMIVEAQNLALSKVNDVESKQAQALHKQSVMHFKMFGRKLTLLDVFWLIVAIAYTVSIVKHFIVP